MLTKLLLLCLGLVVPSLGARLPYIIGGSTVTDSTRWPWQCSLRNYHVHNCGATIISPTWLLTAAHCVGDTKLRDVKCGSVDRKNDGYYYWVEQEIVHENLDNGPGLHPNDIALLRVDALPMISTIKPVPMATIDPAGYEDCYITGWGDISTGRGDAYLSTYLQQAYVNVYTPTECKSSWGSRINAGHICAGDSEIGRGSCYGDSGGPLICKIDGEFQLAGIMSWMSAGCYTSYPSVYSRVSYVREWIKTNSGV